MLQCLSDKAFLTAVQSCFKPSKICIIKPEPSLLLNQGHIQDFYNWVSISKKLQEFIGISSDQLLTIQILLTYICSNMQKLVRSM